MQNKDTSVLLVIHALPHFPDYFIHPIQKILNAKDIQIEYIDLDSHSDSFYVDFVIQSLERKTQIFVYIQADTEQKKIPENCTKILSRLQKIKEKVHILLPVENIMLKAYTRNFCLYTEADTEKQAQYIIEKLNCRD